MEKIRLGTKEDGSPLYHIHAPGEHVVFTGPITGTVETSQGTVDVSPDPIVADSEEHAAEIAFAIGERYAEEGHPSHDDGNPFVHDHPKAKAGKR